MLEEAREDSPKTVVWAWLAAAALLACFVIMARWAFWAKSAAFEEQEQIGAGWAYRKAGDGRFHPQEPPLAKFLLALPARGPMAAERHSLPAWRTGDAAALGKDLLAGAVGRSRLYGARWVSLLFGVALALGVLRWSFQLWGLFGGLFSLALFVFSPAMLGFASLATVDMPAAAFGFYAVYGFWRAYRDQSLGRVVFVAFAAAAAAGSRYVGAGVYVLLGALCLLGIFLGDAFYPFSGPGEGEDPRGLWLRLVWNYLGAMGIILLGGWLGLSALQGFEFSPGWYVKGLRDLISRTSAPGPVFFAGAYSAQGFFWAPLWAFCFKTPPAVLASALLGFACVRRGRVYDATCVAAVGALALLGAMVAGRSGHLDELLLVHCALFVLAGAIFQPPLLPRALHVLAAAGGLVWLICSALALAPNYFAYANFLGGGREGAAQRFDAADRDWGRDAPALRHALLERGAKGAGVFFPSLGQPEELRGLEARNLAQHPEEVFFPWPGLYAVGLRDLQRPNLLGLKGFGFHWLEDYKPRRILGDGLYLYEFEAAGEGQLCGYDEKTGVNRISAEWLWERNRPRLEQLRAANLGDSRVEQIRAAGLFNHGIALLNGAKSGDDYKLAVERLTEADRAGVLPPQASLALFLGLAQADRALGRREALREDIHSIRGIDPDNPVAQELEKWLELPETMSDER